ncbi:MAG: hypothetical protein ACF788_03945 [Novipirellula sp. JB048]
MTTTILYPYYAAAADGDELRFSLRSLAENLQGDYEPVIIGDIPDWYTGAAIELPRITQDQYRQHTGKKFHAKWHPIVDVVWKIAAAAQTPEISDTFIVWYDETHLFGPVDLSYFLTPRYLGDIPPHPVRNNEFNEALIRSRARLKSRGLPTRDFATHHPYPICKQDLPGYYAEFTPLVSPSIIEAQYHNWRGIHCEKSDKENFQYMNRRKCESFAGEFPDAKTINFGIVTPSIESALAKRFRTPSPWEKQP